MANEATTGAGETVAARGRADYADRQESRRERLETAAARAQATSDGAFAAARAIGDVVPFGQPILVGHHSERRARRDADRIRSLTQRSVDAGQRARDLSRAAESVGTSGVSSDDPDAVAKLRAQLVVMTTRRDRMKASNAAARKVGSELPFDAFQLSNLGANIRRIEKRIAELSAPAPTFETIVGVWYRIEARADLNRIALVCGRRTSDVTFHDLRSSGWRWSPTDGAFLVGLTNRGIWAARQAAALLDREVAS